jgi:hypothetical protein
MKVVTVLFHAKCSQNFYFEKDRKEYFTALGYICNKFITKLKEQASFC